MLDMGVFDGFQTFSVIRQKAKMLSIEIQYKTDI